jgi:hypothetical protein
MAWRNTSTPALVMLRNATPFNVATRPQDSADSDVRGVVTASRLRSDSTDTLDICCEDPFGASPINVHEFEEDITLLKELARGELGDIDVGETIVNTLPSTDHSGSSAMAMLREDRNLARFRTAGH